MDKVPPKPRKPKNFTREELLQLDKEQLINRVIQLEAHNNQLRNIISKKNAENSDMDDGRRHRSYNFAECNFRPILLKILYFGWNYQGFVVQEDSTQTIEHYLFNALTKSCLIETREKSNYHRCGRTDKGVSAFGQVISLTIRSKLPEDRQNDTTSELPYCKILNRLLPKDIRVVSWMPVPKEREGLSARFDCKKRQYKYYFPKSNLDLNRMKEAATLLIGTHDFRNLCKMDVGNGVTAFIRTILKADICPVDSDGDQPTSMYYLLIEGNAFLWHQIRCIMAILLLIGSGKETPDIITQLLDKDRYNRKPQYEMAIDVPLNLFKCSYDIEETNSWIYDRYELAKVISELQSYWTMHNVKATMIKDCLKELELKYSQIMSEMEDDLQETDKDSIISYTDCLTLGIKPKTYVPLLKRGTCPSLEEKIEHYKKRRKLPADTIDEIK